MDLTTTPTPMEVPTTTMGMVARTTLLLLARARSSRSLDVFCAHFASLSINIWAFTLRANGDLVRNKLSE